MRQLQKAIATRQHPNFYGLKKGLFILCAMIWQLTIFANSPTHLNLLKDKFGKEYPVLMDCDNATDGGEIAGDEAGCPNPIFDPALITNVTLPSGGSGMLEYLWISTTDDPTQPNAQWDPIPGSNTPEYDPLPITETTYFRRCARRDECLEYVAESNIVVKEIDCCDNVTDGGQLCCNQQGCLPEFDPDIILNLLSPMGGSGDLEYLWFMSTVGPPFIQGSPDWVEVPNSNDSSFDPGLLTETTYFIRCSRRSDCEMYTGETNIITIELIDCCDNVTDGGQICCDQEGCAPFDPEPLVNLVSPMGGTGNLEYLWFESNVGPPFIQGSPDWTEIVGSNSETFDPPAVSDTTWYIRCSRREGCTEYEGETNIIQVNVLPSPILEATVDGEILCFGDETANIDLTVTGGTPDYNYNWDNGIGGVIDPQNISNGIYTVTVVDANMCSSTLEVEVEGPDSLTLTITPTNIGCEGGTTGSAEVQIAGGTPDYSIQWDDPAMQTMAIATNLAAGIYTVTVTDMIGCQAVGQVEIIETPPFTYTLNKTDITCFGDNNGFASISNVMGGVPPYTFQWSDPAMQTTQIINNLTAGTYFVTISDSGICSVVDSVQILEGTNIQVGTSATNVTCAGGNDGTVTVFDLSGENPPVTFQWDDPNMQTTQTATNLSAGIYSVVVTDSLGCTATDTVEVMEGMEISITLEGTNETCAGENDGSVDVTSVGGGGGPFTYSWSPNGETTMMIEDLAPAVYTVTVTNQDGCAGVASYEVLAGSQLQLSLSKQDVMCGGMDNGQGFVTISGGDLPYSFQWDDPAMQTTPVASNLAAGTYSVTVTDGNGCTASDMITINGATEIEFSIDKTDATCANVDNGTATVNILNGDINDFTFIWDDQNNTNTFNVTGLMPGTYNVSILNSDGCMDIGMVTIEEPTILSLDFDMNQTTCGSMNDGGAMVTAMGGTPPYAYQWDDPNNSTTNFITNVPEGIYSITVTDANNCIVLGGVEVTAPESIDITANITNENCPNSNDGAIELMLNGGMPNYTYSWNNGATTSTLNNLGEGDYSVTVTDANGCSNEATFTVNRISNLNIQILQSDASCPDADDGAASVLVFAAAPPISILWNDDNNSTTNDIEELAPGFYGVTVTDGNGCTASGTAEIFEPAPLNLTISKEDVFCESDTDGSATVSVIGGNGPFSYQWNDSNNQSTQTASNLAAGDYTVIVTDVNGCTTSGMVSINIATTLSLATTAFPTSCFDGNDGQIIATGSGGSFPYTYQWSNGDSGSTITGLTVGNYTVTITDSAGCTTSEMAAVTQPTPISCNAEVIQHPTTFDGNDGAASVNANGGTGSYSYEWSDGQTSQIASNLIAGNYLVTVSDANNCTCESMITLVNPAKIGNFVWNDINENGVQNVGEPGIMGVTVTLTGTTNNGVAVNFSTTTDNAGEYAFDNLEAGDYQIHFEQLPTYNYTQNNVGNEDLDSDASPLTGSADVISIELGECNNSIDAGFFQFDDKINIGDFIWLDGNRNGIQDNGENGIQGVAVRLINAGTNGVVAATTSNFLGFYEFVDVMPGSYQIEFVKTSLPTGYTFSPQNEGIDDELDSDPDTLTGFTDIFEVFPFTPDDYSFDAGAYPKCENVTDGGAIEGTEEVCGIGGDPAPITNVTLPSGGFGVLEYIWLQSNVPVYNGIGDPNWTAIPNSNAQDYDPGPITQTTYYIRCARRECCTDYVGETNIIAKFVKEAPLANIEPGPNIACDGELVDFEATNAGGGASYFWNFGDGAIPQTGDTRIFNDVQWTTAGVKTVSLTVTRLGCSVTVTRNITIVNCIAPLVVFDNFSIETNETANQLIWQVSENNSDGIYYIKHSDDGETFTTIGILENDMTETEFQFLDEDPRNGENYYQIEFNNLNGFQINTDTEMAYLEAENTATVQFYPNPFRETGTIELLKTPENPIQIIITNGFGQIFLETEISAGQKKRSLDLGHLPIGFYFVTYRQDGKRDRVQRIFKGDR